MGHYRFSVHYPLWLAVVLLVGLMLAVTMASAASPPTDPASPLDAPGGVQGFLYEPDGTTPVEGGWIGVQDEEGQSWMGATTAPNGRFNIYNLPPGIYVLRAYPPEGSPYAASLPEVVEVLSGDWAQVDLLLTEVRISGYVRDCETPPAIWIEGAMVVAHNADWSVAQWDETSANGEFKIGGLEIGVSYTLAAFPPPDSVYVAQEPITVAPIITNVILELCLPPTNVVGLIHDPTGAPAPEARVAIFNDAYWDDTTAGAAGDFSFSGLPSGAFTLWAMPPENTQGLVASELVSVVITSPTTLVDVGVITLPYAYKIVTGHVVLAGFNTGVSDAEVWGYRLDGTSYAYTTTGADGEFTLGLTGGEWYLHVAPLDWSANWVFVGPPAWVSFEDNTIPETKTVTLEVIPTDARITGRVVCPGGVVCPGEPPSDSIWVKASNDEFSNGAIVDSAYEFIIPVPSGWYELSVFVSHTGFQGPEPIQGFVGPGQTLDMGDIELLDRNASITGRVHNKFGDGVESVPVIGWQPEGAGWSWTETDARGYYTMPVTSGEWFVKPEPGAEHPYVFRHDPQWVRMAPGGMMQGVDFALTSVDALVVGTAVDANTHERLWGLDGWAWAERYVRPLDKFEFFSDSPLWNGGFYLKVKGGYTYNVGLDLPPHAPYVSGGIGPEPIEPGESLSVEVPLEPKDAVIAGGLFESLTRSPSDNTIWATVFGEDERGNWVSVDVDPQTADYWLEVVSGTWRLRAWVDPETGYVAAPTPVTVSVQSGQLVTQNFEVWPIDTYISGVALLPDGSPARAYVFAEGESPYVGYYEAYTETDEAGNFVLFVPAGVYAVGAALPDDELEQQGWMNPPPIEDVAARIGEPATGLELRFRRLDGVIQGTVTFTPSAVVSPTHAAYVWGWSENGEWAETQAVFHSNTATYTLRVVSGTIWHVGAVYEDWDNGLYYESPEAPVPVLPPDGQAVQDLTLNGPWSLPQPVIVSFDGAQMQTIELPDGLTLVIPPGALVVSGTVTLYVFPSQALRPSPGREFIGAGYEMWATDQNGREITHFNKNVVLIFPYPSDEVLEEHGVSEYGLVPVYYSTLVGRWILAESYTVDTVHNEITLQIDHFTKWGRLSVTPTGSAIYLPLVVKEFP